ncbi:acyltransferase [Gordonia sp. LSe1-13]|uniref:Acyltransferase n=1 Tax=Gordonia sesuvii TaxID=3116777 RepID=A0ABU7ME46_9ACTN|nr:acyltransferase [Gordonia sp. LSe1-13]
MSRGTSTARTRWVDIAKAIAILLVALHHSILFLTAAGLAGDVWTDIDDVFVVFRMPLFFFASGLFALSVIRRPWARLWQTRLALLVWVFAVWSVVRFGFFHIVDSPLPLDETKLLRLAVAPLWPQTGLWFLHALVVFFVAAKLLDVLRVPLWLQIGAAGAVSVPFFAGATVGNISYDGMLQYFVFFLVACHFRDRILPAVQRCGIVAAGVALAVFGVGYAVVAVLGIENLPGPLFVLAILALAAGLLLSRTIDRFEPLGRPAGWIGRQTLPIYVAHVLVIGALTSLLSRVADTSALDVVRPVLPVVVMAAAVAISLLIWRAIRDVPVLRYAYEAPPFVRDLPVRTDQRKSRTVNENRRTVNEKRRPVDGKRHPVDKGTVIRHTPAPPP